MSTNPSVSEALASFLKRVPVNFAEDLTSRFSLEMETQINADPSHPHAEPVAGRRNTWQICTDEHGTYNFHHIRIPHNAMSEPSYNDPPIGFPLANHIECCGMTGWNWVQRKSVWVAYDIDAITGHAAGVGISDDALAKVRDAACEIPWVQVRRSTGGGGLHLYVYFDPDDQPDTENHTVHAALARSVLGLMERETGFDFRGNMDVLGGNMWIWHRKISDSNRGLQLIKDYEDFCPKLPSNWRDNLDVITGKSSKVVVRGVGSKDYDSFEGQSSARVKVNIDDTHRQIEERIENLGYSIVWVPDHHCWQTHSKAFEDLHEEYPGEYAGIYKTLSKGDDKGKPNCLAGDTNVITRGGVRPISELAEKDVEVMTSYGKWVSAPFKSYGIQPIMEITLQHGKDTKTIRATPDHRWFVCNRQWNGKTKLNLGDRSEVTTTDLKKDQVLCTVQPQLNITPSVVGIQHGLVWGDGTIGGNRKTASLSLFGEKDSELLRFFEGHPQRTLTNSIGGVEVHNLPYHFKSLVPLDYDKPYLYGWLAGYFAADGCVSKDGMCQINSISLEAMKHVEHICAILGIRTSPIREVKPGKGTYTDSSGYTIRLKRQDLTHDFFLLTHHQQRATESNTAYNSYWKVVSVQACGEEEVFCCTVDEYGVFVLEDFILTGNCFAFPTPNGGIRITRFGRGTKEHETWSQGGTDWTWTYFNQNPSLREAASIFGGVEDPDGKGWVFTDFADVNAVIRCLGEELNIDESWLDIFGDVEGRNIVLRPNKNDQLVVEMDKKKDDKKPKGWIEKGRKYTKLIRTATQPTIEDQENNFDDRVRALVDMNNEFAHWMLLNDKGTWVVQNKDNIRSALRIWSPDDAEDIIGQLVIKNWQLVNVPFQPEYLGNRLWNRDAPQYAVQPAESGTPHEHWDMILNHVGQDLDDVVKGNDWCQEYGINCGADYLLYWIAFMFRQPYCKLPYLFFYGPQNSGKSCLHEAISLLMTGGVQLADEAVKNQNFNGELAGKVLCVIEETDLSSKSTLAYNRIKAWSMGQDILIHKKGKQATQTKNATHWVQCANEKTFVPIFPGDTRITMMYVPMPDEAEIPKDLLFQHLRDQAPAFLRTLIDLKLPPQHSRTAIPVLMTQSKREAERSVEGLVDKFIFEKCYHVPGAIIKFSDFYKAMTEWMGKEQAVVWTSYKVADEFRNRSFEPFVFGRSLNNVACIGNVSVDKADEGKTVGPTWVRKRQKLIQDKEPEK